MSSSNSNFYRDLEPFYSFVDEAFCTTFYVELPADWTLVVADITGSTRAVKSGKYAGVNYLGAACIVAVTNALDDVSVPSVFGGDGATFAVPEDVVDTVMAALKATRRWGRDAFGLELRVGAVPMAEIIKRGASVQLAKMEFSPGNAMAMFRGDGFDLADKLVKDGDDVQTFVAPLDDDDDSVPDLKSLSCRWSPLPSVNGSMLCLIIGAHAKNVAAADEIYRDVIARIYNVVPINQVEVSPVKLETLEFGFTIENIVKKAKTLPGPRSFTLVRAFLTQFLGLIAFTVKRPLGEFEPERYQKEMVINSDFRKVNGMLRLILDCTDEHCGAIEQMLDTMHDEQRIVYGSHRATQAIMACVAPDVVQNQHVHYIDGSEGGLWSAATGLKLQIRELDG
tara:strand:- start:629 stop:1813 length:1185 start_codon:yes stop_codon:yes gene_type:complete